MYKRRKQHEAFFMRYDLPGPRFARSHALIAGEFGYKVDDIVMLTDDAQNPRQIPTRDNMVRH